MYLDNYLATTTIPELLQTFSNPNLSYELAQTITTLRCRDLSYPEIITTAQALHHRFIQSHTLALSAALDTLLFFPQVSFSLQNTDHYLCSIDPERYYYPGLNCFTQIQPLHDSLNALDNFDFANHSTDQITAFITPHILKLYKCFFIIDHFNNDLIHLARNTLLDLYDDPRHGPIVRNILYLHSDLACNGILFYVKFIADNAHITQYKRIALIALKIASIYPFLLGLTEYEHRVKEYLHMVFNNLELYTTIPELQLICAQFIELYPEPPQNPLHLNPDYLPNQAIFDPFNSPCKSL